MEFFLVIILVLEIKYRLITCDCGAPAIPDAAYLLNSNKKDRVNVQERYNEGSVLFSECSNGYTIGNNVDGFIRCENGKWNASFRRCAIEQTPVPNIISVVVEDVAKSQIIVDKVSEKCWRWNVTKLIEQKWTLTLNKEREFDMFLISIFNVGGEGRIPHPESSMKAQTDKLQCHSNGVWKSKSYGGKYFYFYCDYNKIADITTNVVILNFTPQNDEETEICDNNLDLMKIIEDCGAPEKPLNSIVYKNMTTNEAIFACVDDFKLVGNRVLKCENQGHWRGAFPRCELANCSAQIPVDKSIPGLVVQYKDPLNQPLHLSVGGVVVPGSKAIVKCEIGSDFKSELSCRNGKWIGEYINCSDTKEIIDISRNEINPFWIIVAVLGAILIFVVSLGITGIFIWHKRQSRPQQNISQIMGKIDRDGEDNFNNKPESGYEQISYENYNTGYLEIVGNSDNYYDGITYDDNVNGNYEELTDDTTVENFNNTYKDM